MRGVAPPPGRERVRGHCAECQWHGQTSAETPYQERVRPVHMKQSGGGRISRPSLPARLNLVQTKSDSDELEANRNSLNTCQCKAGGAAVIELTVPVSTVTTVSCTNTKPSLLCDATGTSTGTAALPVPKPQCCQWQCYSATIGSTTALHTHWQWHKSKVK